MQKRKLIAITGTIGSGKSTVGNYLLAKNFYVIDCDKISREVAKSNEVVAKVAALLGDGYIENGALDRRAIRSRIFSDKEILQRYNEIFHGEIEKRLIDTVKDKEGYVFVEIPLLDAVNLPWFQIWQVIAGSELQTKRVALRDGVDQSQTTAILSSQNDKISDAIILVNNKDVQYLFNQVDKLLLNLN